MGHKPVPIRQLHPKQMVRQNFHYGTFNADGLFSGHVNISGSFSVISTVCSKCAEGSPSRVTTVHPSFNISTAGFPALTIGSIAIVIPGRKSCDDSPAPTFGT